MNIRTNLKLVENVRYEEKQGTFWSNDLNYVHSLHQILPVPYSINPELVSYFITQFSNKGDFILDPFCGSGTVALESNLHGRVAVFSDISPLSYRMALVKTIPADITDVTLLLQKCNVRRPINLSHYNEHFKPFFDIDTFREIVNVKVFLADQMHTQEAYIARFIELITMSLLHGNSAGFFSAYSSPLISLSPTEQDSLNFRRGQLPDYRAVLPRILRKTATVLRDGIASSTKLIAGQNISSLCDAQDLSYLPSASVALTITNPPMPFTPDPFEQMWLRSWFSGNNHRSYNQARSLEGFRELMNASLLEIARVTKPGGRAVINNKIITVGKDIIPIDRILLEDIRESLNRYWDTEGLVINLPKSVTIKNKDRLQKQDENTDRVLILRRR